MKNLVTIMQQKAVVSSLDVADHFHKRHDNVVRAVENILGTHLKIEVSERGYKPPLSKMAEKSFFEGSYSDKSGRVNKMYWMNRDGFSVLAMGFSGKDALKWKWKYISAFNEMERRLNERKTLAWGEVRSLGKETRLDETDAIEELIKYAKEQGSQHAHMLYAVYSKLARQLAGIEGIRGLATLQQLKMLDDAESTILHVIRRGMAEKLHYKDIYKECKARLLMMEAYHEMQEDLLAAKAALTAGEEGDLDE